MPTICALVVAVLSAHLLVDAGLTPALVTAPPSSNESDTRDGRARSEYASGFVCLRILNSGYFNRDGGNHGQAQPPSRQDLEYLLQAKCLFCAGLRNMQLEYITQIVFDRSHRTLALIKNGKVCKEKRCFLCVYKWVRNM